MSNLSRRDVLKLAAAVPAVLSLPQTPKSQPDKKQRHAAPQTALTTLAVVFHGSFAFVRLPNQIHVLVPPSPPKHPHEQRAGEWGNTIGLGSGAVYALDGVVKAKSTPDNMFREESNLILKGKLPYMDAPPLIHCKLVLPLPKKIHEARWSDFPGGNCVQGADFYQAGKLRRITTVWVFEYDVEEQESLGLKPAPSPGWKIGQGPSNSTGEFHIFCDAPGLVSHDHAEAMMRQIVKIFPGADLRLKCALLALGENSEVTKRLVQADHLETLRFTPRYQPRLKIMKGSDRTCGGCVAQG